MIGTLMVDPRFTDGTSDPIQLLGVLGRSREVREYLRCDTQLTVSTETSFPLPMVVFTVRALYYRNWRPERGLYLSSITAALQRPGRLTNLNSGIYTPGDTYAFDIVLDEMAGNSVVWRKVLRTPWVTVS